MRLFFEKSKAVPIDSCSQCKASIKKDQQRYYCCEKKKFVCRKCSKNICKQCSKKRENKMAYAYCSFTKCKKLYERDDMFYDFKGNYVVCPRCLRKEYQFFYQIALKQNKDPDEVKLSTSSVYPYKDLVNYFKNWCFSCANKIGQQDAYQMIRGPRICSNCIAFNAQTITRMVRCISCEGFIHTLKEVFQTFGSEIEVICIYCAQKHKEEYEKALIKAQHKIIQPKISKISSINSSVIKSALRIFKGNSQEQNENAQKQQKKYPTASRLSSAHSIQFQEYNVPLSIIHQQANQKCDICNSSFHQWNLFSIKKTDKNLTSSILQVLEKNKSDMKMCAFCFGEYHEDHGQTIQFDTPPTRTLKIQEQDMNQARVVIPKLLRVKSGASQNVFKNSK